MNQLETITEGIRSHFVAVDGVREMAYKVSRELTRMSAHTIRAVHRSEWETAEEMLAQAREVVVDLVEATRPFPQIHWAGYTQDCMKEYTEAELTYALVRGRPLRGPAELHVDEAAWLNGLAEAATELRRRILDIIRHDHKEEAEGLLTAMDDVYSILVTFDFRDAITGGLRRRTDTVRAVLERTRGDVTTSLRQNELEKALARVEAHLKEDGG